MAFYSLMFSANYKCFFENLKKVAKAEKRWAPALALDTAWCVVRYGFALSDYLNYRIYARSGKERREYVGVRDQNTLYEQVSPSRYKTRYTVKPNFLREFHDYVKREFCLPGEDSFEAFQAFVQRNSVFMSKPYDGLGGMDVRKVHAEDIEDLKAYYDTCVEKHIFLEEVVRQHPEMNRLCAKSVNTIRIMTFNDHGKSEILWMGLRVGNGKNDVDNFHAQGMGVAIDMETGKLKGNALDKDCVAFSVHPTSGVPFDGFQIPCFEEAKQMVLKASLESDKILVVGWDVAISENGPLIIEGNRRPGFDLVQMLDERGRRDMMRDVMYRASTLPENRK